GRFLAIGGEPRAVLAEATALAGGGRRLDELAEAWERRLEGLAGVEVPAARLRFEAGFARAFGYYDGMLFEVRSEALGADQPLAAGGRYDSLPARLGADFEGRALGCMVRPYRAWREGAS
ncbi:MAG: ATP phosphoribosyltransferase regulatory subunit, partial [Caulobacteraceae bacterium]